MGRLVSGEYIKHDALFENHAHVSQALDAFLRMDRYLTDEMLNRYTLANQRELCIALKKHSTCAKMKEEDNRELENIGSIVKQ